MSETAESQSLNGDDLIVLLYRELRDLARTRLQQENPGHTLQATALVHEAYLRIERIDTPPDWKSRSQFFAAAAEAMRRILIDRARQKKSERHGGRWTRIDLAEPSFRRCSTDAELMLTLDDALTRLETTDQVAASLARLIIFAGCTVEDASELLQISRTTGYREWTYARARLLSELT